MHCRHCGERMQGDGHSWNGHLACPNFNPHPDLCPEPDSGPWNCDTDGITQHDGDRDNRGADPTKDPPF